MSTLSTKPTRQLQEAQEEQSVICLPCVSLEGLYLLSILSVGYLIQAKQEVQKYQMQQKPNKRKRVLFSGGIYTASWRLKSQELRGLFSSYSSRSISLNMLKALSVVTRSKTVSKHENHEVSLVSTVSRSSGAFFSANLLVLPKAVLVKNEAGFRPDRSRYQNISTSRRPMISIPLDLEAAFQEAVLGSRFSLKNICSRTSIQFSSLFDGRSETKLMTMYQPSLPQEVIFITVNHFPLPSSNF